MQAEITREWVTCCACRGTLGTLQDHAVEVAEPGRIKAARVGRAVRINRRSLDGYLEHAAEGS